MKSLILIGLAFMAPLLTASSAFGIYFTDGNELVSNLYEHEKAERRETFNGVGDGLFMGFVIGVTDTLGDTLCISGKVTGRQVYAIAAKYLKEHPEQWSQPAYQLVTSALRSAFPCRK